LYVDDTSLLYPTDTTTAAIEVKARLSQEYKITYLSQAHEFLSIDIHYEGNSTGISLGEMFFITTFLRLFNMQNAHDVSTPMNPNVKLDLAQDRGE